MTFQLFILNISPIGGLPFHILKINISLMARKLNSKNGNFMHGHVHQSNPEVKERALHRVKIIQGHVKKVLEMLERDEYCVDIVHQSRAVQSALKKLDLLIIEDHLSSCVVDQIRNGEIKSSTEELLKLFEYKS